MAVKIRLRQGGRKNERKYRVVVADARFRRDGKFNECLGWYNPHSAKIEEKAEVDLDRVKHWYANGAEITVNTLRVLKHRYPDFGTWYHAEEDAKRLKKRLKRKKRRSAANAAAPAKKEAAPAKKTAAKKSAKKVAAKKAEDK